MSSSPEHSGPGFSPTGVSAAHEAVLEDLPRLPDGARWERRTTLGVGGMGRVVLVRDRWLSRDVAVKEPATDADARRLWREAMVTARLEHPGIVPVYDLGTGPDGRPWFAMRIVRGRSLAEVLRGRATFEARRPLLRALLAVCEAVAYAHSRGVVHRDLKTDNVMIGPFGEAQVIDWGLALTPDAPPTEARAGTPHAMSPEQARGEPLDPRSDVWSLGAILWELCAGRRAFPQATSEDVLAAVRTGVAPPLGDEVPRELAAIVQRAMATEREARYADSRELAADLERWLDGRRVTAHAYTTVELVKRLARAWRVPLVVAAVALVVVAVVMVMSFARVSRERDVAEHSLATALVGEARRALRVDARGEAEILARYALRHATDERHDPALAAEARGVLLGLAGPRPAREVVGPLGCTAIDLVATRALCSDTTTLSVLDGGAERWSVSRDGQLAAFVGGGRVVASAVTMRGDALGQMRVEWLDAATGANLGADLLGGRNRFVASSPDHEVAVFFGTLTAELVTADTATPLPPLCGAEFVLTVGLSDAREGLPRRIAAACDDGSVALSDLASGRPLARVAASLGTLPRGPLPRVLTFATPDRVLVGDDQGRLAAIDVGAPERRALVATSVGLVRQIAVAADGSRAALLGEVGAPLLVSLPSLDPLGRLPTRPIGAIDFDERGRLVTAGAELERWDFTAVRPRTLALGEGVVAMAAAPSGDELAIAHASTVAVIDPARRAITASHHWQDQFVKTLDYTPDGVLLAHGLGAPETRRFRGAADDGRYPGDPSRRWRRVTALPDGSLLASPWGTHLSRVRPGLAPTPVAELELTDLVSSPDGALVAGVTSDGDVVCADGAALEVEDEARGRAAFHACGHVPGGSGVARREADRVLVAGRGGVDELDVASGRPVRRFVAAGADLGVVVAVSGVVAAGARDGAVWIWRDEPEPWAVLRDHASVIAALAIDPRGRWLAAGDWDGRATFLGLALPGDSDEDAVASWGLSLDQAFDPRTTGAVPPGE